MSIVTLEQAKAQLNIDDDDDSDDDELQRWCDALTAPIERYKREVIEERTVIEDLELCGRRRFRLWSVPVISLTSLVDIETGREWDVTPSALRVDSGTGLVRVLSAAQAPSGFLTATYQAGYAEIPPDYVQGALVILQHVWETQRGAAEVGAGVVGEEEVHDLRHFYTLPRKALEWLGAPRPVVG